MDKEIRNRIQRATQAARRLLEDEYAEQLEGRFDIQLDGSVAAEAGVHLREDVPALRVRAKLVAAVAHHCDQGQRKDEAVATLLRECAFTTLNRFVALKMLEARGIVQECVSRGPSSSGFGEFAGLAKGLSTLPDQGYRLYLDSLFDEVGREVRVLFDRRDPASLLWPRRPALEALLATLNDPELAEVWEQDETIGWVYQYFNGEDERREMRAASQAPRNSRELAVRNQFFTPRYVVEFLTDNTLARTWVEMRQGATLLVDECRYLVKRKDEVFLQEPPETAVEWIAAAYRGDFAQLPEQASWEEINILAHAIQGYRLARRMGLAEDEGLPSLAEATRGWREGQHPPESEARAALEVWAELFWEARAQRAAGEDPDGERLVELRSLYATLRRDLLGLEELEPGERPVFVPFRASKDPRDLRLLDPACGSGHFLLYSFDLLVTIYEEAWAEPYWPASEATGRTLREDYPELPALHRALPGLILAHNLHGVDIDPRAAQIAAMALWMRAQRAWNELGFARAERQLVRRTNIAVAEPMPGETDLLEELYSGLDRSAAKIVRAVFEDMKLAGEAGTLLCIEDTVRQGLEKLSSPGEMFAVQDAERWKRVEEQVYGTLKHYAEELGGEGYRRRLFAEDAARGFAFIEICRQKYDVVLMNPPFGSMCTGAKRYITTKYFRSRRDIYAAFVERGVALNTEGGTTGVLSSRAGFFLTSFQQWRKECVLGSASPTLFADLGYGVLDAALVEVSAYCLKAGAHASNTLFIRVLEELNNKGASLLDAVNGTDGTYTHNIYSMNSSELSGFPGSVFAYWAEPSLRRSFSSHSPLREKGVVASVGDHPGDTFRWVRCWTEVASEAGQTWRSYQKGGVWSPYYCDIHLVSDWDSDRETYRGFTGRPGRAALRPSNYERFFRPGLTWPLRTKSDLSVRVLPHGCFFSHKGPVMQVEGDSVTNLLGLLAVANSQVFRSLVLLQVAAADAKKGGAARSYEVGIVQQTPIPSISPAQVGLLARLSYRSWSLRRTLDTRIETSHAFHLPALHQAAGSTLAERAAIWNGRVAATEIELAAIQAQIEHRCFDLYGITDQDRGTIEYGIGQRLMDEADPAGDDGKYVGGEADSAETDLAIASNLVAWAVGVSTGRFDLRLATGERKPPPEPDPFAPLPPCSPGMLTGEDGLPVAKPPPDYPITFPTDGILVDDPGADRDLLARARQVFAAVFGEHGDDRLREATEAIDPGKNDLRPWLRSKSFEAHIKRYSKSRRKAPIYWQLGTPSASYSVWQGHPARRAA